MQRTAIIVPCYNESQRLKGHEFTYYARKNRWIYFIFVNDGSTDNTQEIIDELCSTNSSQIISIRHTKNLGKAEAVRRGFLQAIEMGVENIGYWDADLSTPLHSIDSLCGVLANDKITTVMGSRVKLLGRRIERLAIRHYLGRVFATFASLLLRLPVYDTQCGAKIFKNNDDIRKISHVFFYLNLIRVLSRHNQTRQGLCSQDFMNFVEPIRDRKKISQIKKPLGRRKWCGTFFVGMQFPIGIDWGNNTIR